ncbi:chaperone for protein-folding within the ER, fungal-domain-containing protein [Pyronema domesticum]|uniref:Protein ROT1 n=1 Tax=Pyronema omphalodes (strain CBS 100304) TaxID=1076935 RepID=U4L1I5_PYROM|nr:chaperone for protein-folding within the ER, fungal-domain-containing protein [Pyronema domesticum]CCX09722.1 Similar to Protein rot1; acc. no. A1CDT3 [Pyronema omphalodes CBS 100304]
MLPKTLILIAAAATTATAQATVSDPQLVGTWVSKSGTVVTGPDIYNPTADTLNEPRLPGSSFSFTADGHYENALYTVVANPTTPSCPSAVIQWQHGTYIRYANGSLSLQPIKEDGRQLYADPCTNDKSIYTKYNQTEIYKWYEIITDARHKKPRLNLYQFDGAPANPLYLEYRPPQMLPTTAFHSTRPTDNENKKGRRKRDIGYEAIRNIKGVEKMGSVKEEWLVVLGIGMTALGSVGFFWF